MITGKTQAIREGVRKAYSEAAIHPQTEHPFPNGRAFAEKLGYPPTLLDELPAIATQSFAGVSYVGIFADIPAGATVLDLGCGAGLDSLIAARKTGSSGQVIGVDFSKPMLTRARQAANESSMGQVIFLLASGEQLPLKCDSVDLALVNGIFNLNPARDMIFHELARVIKPGGSVYAAELILREALTEAEKSSSNWFA